MAEIARPADIQRTHRARRARDLLREDVLSQRWGAGPVPSERELERMLAASRNVVRDALMMLLHEGLLARVPGAGTFVVGRKATYRFHILRGIGEDTPEVSAAEGSPTSYEIRTLDVVPAPRRVAESCSCRRGRG
jgi:GntR family transcriptional regulator